VLFLASLSIRFGHVRVWGSQCHPPDWGVLGQGAFEFEECGSLTFHNPDTDVRWLFSDQRSNRARNALYLYLHPIMLSVVFDKTHLEASLLFRKDIQFDHPGTC
jgi:hypothetical protein